MSIMNPDDDMRAMIDALDLAEPDPNVNLQSRTDRELVSDFGELTEQLKELGELLHPHTDAGRELHSARAALMVVMIQRGLR